MYLNLHILADALAEFQPVLHTDDANRLYLRQIRELRTWDQAPQPRTVYVGSAAELAAYAFREQIAAYICIGGTGAELSPFTNLQCIFVSPDTTAQNIIAHVDAAFARFDEVNERFLNAIISNAPLHDVLTDAADFFQNPIFCFDMSMAVLDMVDHYGQDEIDRKKWNSSVQYGHVSRQTVEFISEHYRKNAFDAYFEDYTQEQLHMIVAQIWWNREKMLGAMIIGDDFKRMNAGYLALANYVSPYVAELIYRQNRNHIDYSAIDTVFQNMLNGFKSDDSYLETGIAPLNWKLADHYCVCVLPLCQAERQCGIYNYGAKTIKTIFERYQCSCFYSIRAEDQLFFVNCQENHCISEELVNALRNAVRTRNTCIGISPVMTSVKNIPSLYTLAKEAVRIGQRFENGATVFLYDRLRLLHLLDFEQRPENIFAVCDSRVLALAEQDKESDLEYIKTLYVYLLHERSLKAAAAALFIHRNSLVYRLSKINDFLQYDLGNPTIREQVFSSCKLIMMYSGREAYLQCLLSSELSATL